MFCPGIENSPFVAVFIIVTVNQFRANPLPLFWELFQCTAPKNQMADFWELCTGTASKNSIILEYVFFRCIDRHPSNYDRWIDRTTIESISFDSTAIDPTRIDHVTMTTLHLVCHWLLINRPLLILDPRSSIVDPRSSMSMA